MIAASSTEPGAAPRSVSVREGMLVVEFTSARRDFALRRGLPRDEFTISEEIAAAVHATAARRSQHGRSSRQRRPLTPTDPPAPPAIAPSPWNQPNGWNQPEPAEPTRTRGTNPNWRPIGRNRSVRPTLHCSCSLGEIVVTRVQHWGNTLRFDVLYTRKTSKDKNSQTL